VQRKSSRTLILSYTSIAAGRDKDDENVLTISRCLVPRKSR
jgi:hypothetical protein